ncbi:MAG: hypothetical protein AAF485_01500 [Chloroflexota bacterium]
MKRSTLILGVAVSISLLLNLTLLFGVNVIRLATLDTLNQTNQMLAQLAQETVVYYVALDQAIPVQASVPFQREMDIPVDTVIPIDQTFTLPLQTPAGEITVTLPLQANFPVNVMVPLSLDEQVDLDTNIHLKTTIPVNIEIGKTPLADYLTQSRSQLISLQNLLSFGADQLDVSIRSELVESHPQPDLAQSDVNAPSDQPITTPSDAPLQQATVYTQITDSSSPPLPTLSNQDLAKELGACLHEYWPLRPGTSWAFTSDDTAFDQTVSWVRNNQVQLISAYENQDLTFDLICYQEGLGGNYMGDVRRLREFGDFVFSNPRGIFLPLAVHLEQENYEWEQELDVAGTVLATWQDRPISGQIEKGHLIATYQTMARQTIPTPLGFKDAIPIQQRLRFELIVSFQLGQETLVAQQTLELGSLFYFVKGIGPTQIHWQGGTLQLRAQTQALSPFLIETGIPTLSPDHLTAVCFTKTDGQVTCRHTPDLPTNTLTQAAGSELVVAPLNLPSSILAVIDTKQDTGEAAIDPHSASKENNQSNTNTSQGSTNSTVSDNALKTYIITINVLSDEVIDVLGDFQSTVFAYAENKISRDQFANDFETSKSDINRLISTFDSISPPAQADSVHQDFNKALAKCNQAKNLLEDWFNTGDSSERDTGVFLYTECIKILANAKSAANSLLN